MKQNTNTKAGMYHPKKILMVMSAEDSETVNMLGLELVLQGADTVHSESDDLTAAVLLQHNQYDVVITGVEFPYVAEYIKSRNDSNRPLTVAVSTNGVKADVKVPDAKDLIGYVSQSLLAEHYCDHRTAQVRREESESPQMAYANLEIALMNAQAV
ncbi:hypothetical protein JW898_02445 [Candidatus Woesearchaeota archaeon]|nr:hypothetical protein [Candidatus Woesearchaeota archaeon]